MRYFFHLRVGETLSPDEVGLEFPDLETAYLNAFEAAQEMWRELLAARSDPLIRSFEIANRDGQILLTLPFSEVLERARRASRPRTSPMPALHAVLQERNVLMTSLHEQIRNLQEKIEGSRSDLQAGSDDPLSPRS